MTAQASREKSAAGALSHAGPVANGLFGQSQTHRATPPDEIDALAPTRSSGDDLSARRVLTELLLCMTALAGHPSCLVFVFAATNRLCDCDPALLRR